MRQQLVELSSDSRDRHLHLEVLTFTTFLSQDQVRSSAAGLFRVGTHLVPCVSNSVKAAKVDKETGRRRCFFCLCFVLFFCFCLQMIGAIITYLIVLLQS